MNKYKVLILTDHKNHSKENSLYDLSVKLYEHSYTAQVDIASRAIEPNNGFFKSELNAPLYAKSIDQYFSFQKDAHPLSFGYHKVNVQDYDLVWLRLPPPLSEEFLNYIDLIFSQAVVINKPHGILQTGSKKFLLHFQEVCPPMKVCTSLSDIINFKESFPIVLKPFREYGGRGLVKLDGDKVSMNNEQYTFEEFAQHYQENPLDYLAVKFLKNVRQGDKRIVVVNGEIVGASLRLPPKDSWICNVSMGGSSNVTEVTVEEERIVNKINPVLSELGIVMYGVDTLVGDDGKRVLSEINTTSIGGVPQIARLRNEPLVERTIDLIWDFYTANR